MFEIKSSVKLKQKQQVGGFVAFPFTKDGERNKVNMLYKCNIKS